MTGVRCRPHSAAPCSSGRRTAASARTHRCTHLEHDDENQVDDGNERDVRRKAKGMKCPQERDRRKGSDTDRDPHSAIDQRRRTVAIGVEGERVNDARQKRPDCLGERGGRSTGRTDDQVRYTHAKALDRDGRVEEDGDARVGELAHRVERRRPMPCPRRAQRQEPEAR